MLPTCTLQELARERFDSSKLLSVFRRGRPTWLHELAGDPRGRRLILDLSAEHSSSIFLNYAIRRIFDTVGRLAPLLCLDRWREHMTVVGRQCQFGAQASLQQCSSFCVASASVTPARLQPMRLHPPTLALIFPLSPYQGHDDEVAAVGSSLSSYFEVYHRLLARRLAAAATASSPSQLERLAAELSEACAVSQHTYAHAQHVITHLATRQRGAVFHRLSQELEAAAVARHGGATVWAMQPLFVPRDASAQQREAVRLVSRALVLGAGGNHVGGAGLVQVGAAREAGAVQGLLL